MGDAEPVAVSPPGLEVTVYPVTVVRPVFVGGVKLIEAKPSPGEALTAVGAPGLVMGEVVVTELAENVPAPVTRTRPFNIAPAPRENAPWAMIVPTVFEPAVGATAPATCQKTFPA